MAPLTRSLRFAVLLCLIGYSSAAFGAPSASEQRPLHWHGEYQIAWQQAKEQRKMLLLFFHNPQQNDATTTAVEKTFAENLAIRRQLSKFVLAKLPTDTMIHVDGKRVRLLEDASMGEMHGQAGLAIIDLAHEDKPYYGYVVSAYPFMHSKYYRFQPSYLSSILDLPPGTITQRTMVWAVRIHPERPASTHGEKHEALAQEAESHSHYQAQLRSQGHHRWETRFHRIRRLLGGVFGHPVEVVAESWPNQTMIDSCIDCVASWRHSPGHWNAVKSYQRTYGYDIKRGSNGIWYGTGIFAN